MPSGAMGLACIHVCSVLDGIQDVGPSGVPAEVTHVVVGGVTVVMAPLHALWAWANENSQDKTVCEPASLIVLMPKAIENVSAFHLPGSQDSPFPAKLLPSIIGENSR